MHKRQSHSPRCQISPILSPSRTPYQPRRFTTRMRFHPPTSQTLAPSSFPVARMHLRPFLVAISLFCATHPILARPPTAAPVSMIRTELYFGPVPVRQWNEFLAQIVTPLFPDGLTWFNVNGQWRAPDGDIHKLPSRMLIILYPDSQKNDHAIEQVRQQFKSRFHQLSVLRVSSKVTAGLQ
jgi:hypothetical protein